MTTQYHLYHTYITTSHLHHYITSSHLHRFIASISHIHHTYIITSHLHHYITPTSHLHHITPTSHLHHTYIITSHLHHTYITTSHLHHISTSLTDRTRTALGCMPLFSLFSLMRTPAFRVSRRNDNTPEPSLPSTKYTYRLTLRDMSMDISHVR